MNISRSTFTWAFITQISSPWKSIPSQVYPSKQSTTLCPIRMTHSQNSAAVQASNAAHTTTLGLSQMRHSRTFIREAWRCAIERTNVRTVIDTTAGRGSDTITLGKLVGASGDVHAMDIQEMAVEETKQRYEAEQKRAEESGSGIGRLHLRCANHEDLRALGLPEQSVSAVAYNLGWYPSREADRSIITMASSTAASLSSAQRLVALEGIITVTAYLGHAGGQEEAEAVVEWARRLPTKEWSVMEVGYLNRETAPKVIVCERVG